MQFLRENHSHVSLEQMFEQFKLFMLKKPYEQYKLIIGTDSMVLGSSTRYITAITLQRIGNGAIIFYNSVITKKVSLAVRIMNEVEFTIQMANQIIIPKCLEEDFCYPIEIHIDVGTTGKSNQFKNTVIGYVKGCGFDEQLIKVKPDAFGASNVADRYTRKSIC